MFRVRIFTLAYKARVQLFFKTLGLYLRQNGADCLSDPMPMEQAQALCDLALMDGLNAEVVAD